MVSIAKSYFTVMILVVIKCSTKCQRCAVTWWNRTIMVSLNASKFISNWQIVITCSLCCTSTCVTLLQRHAWHCFYMIFAFMECSKIFQLSYLIGEQKPHSLKHRWQACFGCAHSWAALLKYRIVVVLHKLTDSRFIIIRTHSFRWQNLANSVHTWANLLLPG